MHEISLEYSIKDFLSGEQIKATTYEDLRQAIARLLVKRKNYPKTNLRSKVSISYPIDGISFSRNIDLAAYTDAEAPLLILMFCAGVVQTYMRETLAAARLHPNQASKLAVITDTNKAILLRTVDGEILSDGDYLAIPDWPSLKRLAEDTPAYIKTAKKEKTEQRILYAFSQLSCSCRSNECNL